jgi:hypothetical protein
VYRTLVGFGRSNLSIQRINNFGWYKFGQIKVFVEVPKGKTHIVARVGGGFTFFAEFLKVEHAKQPEPAPVPELEPVEEEEVYELPVLEPLPEPRFEPCEEFLEEPGSLDEPRECMDYEYCCEPPKPDVAAPAIKVPEPEPEPVIVIHVELEKPELEVVEKPMKKKGKQPAKLPEKLPIMGKKKKKPEGNPLMDLLLKPDPIITKTKTKTHPNWPYDKPASKKK